MKDGLALVNSIGPALTVKNITMIGGALDIGSGSTTTFTGNFKATSSAAGPASVAPGVVILNPPPGAFLLDGASQVLTINDGPAANDLDISIVIAGVDTAGLTKTGAGTLRFSGDCPNTYRGATVVQLGSLDVARTATTIPGALTVGAGNASAVKLLTTNVVADGSNIGVGAGGVLRANGVSDTVTGISVAQGGEVRLGDNVTASLRIMKLELSGSRVTM